MAAAGEVTERLTAPEEPLGETVIELELKLQVQPAGQDLVKLKVEEPQVELS